MLQASSPNPFKLMGFFKFCAKKNELANLGFQKNFEGKDLPYWY
jgi:hypothetical protein